MNMKKVLAILLILVLGLSVAGCKAIDVMKNLVSEDEEVEILRSDDLDGDTLEDASLRNTVLYYQNENGYLVPVKRQIPWEEGIAKAALKNMVDNPAIREDLGVIGLIPTLPAGTEIRGMAIDEDTGLCKVDFTSEIMNYNTKKDEENIIRSVVYTLTEFPAISEVQILVEGKIVSELTYGTRTESPIKRADINSLETANMGNSKVVVYYKGTSNGEYEYYVPLTIPTLAPSPNVLTALERLFNGAPENTGLYSDIPKGVSLQGVEVKNGVAFIDIKLDSKKTIKDQITFDKMSRNIGLTLREFSDIDMVEILINGKTLEAAGLKISEPAAMPVFANEY